nr:peptidyl-prolyl cis-trans isomerase [Geotalea sp. SG265]
MAGFVLMNGCGKKDEPVAVVGDVTIAAADFQRVLARKARLTGAGAATAGEKRRLLDELIDRKLLCKEGVRLGIAPSTAEVDAGIAEAKAAMSEAAFRSSLQQDGLDDAGFRSEMKENLLVAKVENRIATHVRPDEGKARRYYDGHREDFMAPPSYRVYLVHPDSADEAARLLAKYRQQPAAFDLRALKEEAPELRRINRAAMLTPEGNFPDEMVPLLKKTIPGEVAGPVKTRRGYFLFRLLEKTSGHQKSWGEAKGEVIHLLYQERKKDAVQQWLARQRQGMNIRIGRL